MNTTSVIQLEVGGCSQRCSGQKELTLEKRPTTSDISFREYFSTFATISEIIGWFWSVYGYVQWYGPCKYVNWNFIRASEAVMKRRVNGTKI